MDKPKVCIISFPLQSDIPYIFLSDVIEIIEPIAESIVLIDGGTERIKFTGKNFHAADIGLMGYKIIKPGIKSSIFWMVNLFIVQVLTSVKLIKISKRVDIVLFYMAYPRNIFLPMIVSKLLNKTTIHIITNSRLDFSKNTLLNRFYRMQDRLMQKYIDYISPESESLVPLFNLDRHDKNILPSGARFVHMQDFYIQTGIGQRKNIIGYVGRVIKEKGVYELIDSMQLVLSECSDAELWIIGEISDQDRERIKQNDHIKLFNWISHADLPEYLNEMKMIVLPSEGEGLPTVVLEAMACGTPVLSTPVGGIPDIITDGVTGFITSDNRSATIAKNILRVIKYPELNVIVSNAHNLIMSRFSLIAARGRYKAILEVKVKNEN